MSLYLRSLKKLKENGCETVSSGQITEFLEVSPEQFRKDLSYFGPFGTRGVGYRTEGLIGEIERILGVAKGCKIALIGVGKLGSALLGYSGFANFNFRLVAAFDYDIGKIGKIWEGVKIEDISKLETVIKEQGIKIAIIAVSSEQAQDVAEKLQKCGIKGILNFAPVNLNLSEDMFVLNVDMACELMTLAHIVNKFDK